jgi:hypothetical protein
MEYARFSLPQMADFDLPIPGVFWVPANSFKRDESPKRELWQKIALVAETKKPYK